MSTNNQNKENLEELFEKFLTVQESQQAAENIHKAEPNMPLTGYGEPGRAYKPDRPGGMREQAWQMHDGPEEYLEWLKENYPEKAKELAKLREENPELCLRQVELGLNRHRRILQAAKENPQLAEVLKQDLALRQQQDKLLGAIETAGDKEKEELVKDLKEVINNRFDVIVKRKQIQYEELINKLEKLKERAKQSEAELDKWKNPKLKDENVKARLEELLSKSEKFKWD